MEENAESNVIHDTLDIPFWWYMIIGSVDSSISLENSEISRINVNSRTNVDLGRK